MRCQERVGNSPARFCGELAPWFRRGNDWFADGFFCNRHRHETDVPLPPELVFRRVRLMAIADFAAITPIRSIAQVEAAAVLMAAVERAGGVVSVQQVSSAVGRYTAPAPAPAPPLGSGSQDEGLKH